MLLNNFKISGLVKHMFFWIIIYVYIYNPPFAFLPLSPKFFLYLLVIPFLIKVKFKRYLGYFKALLLIIGVIILYSFLREFGLLKFELLLLNITFLFEILLIPIVIILLYESLEIRGELIFNLILVGFIASLFTLSMIIIPSLSDFIRYRLLRTDEYTEAVSLRTFGLAESLTFSYGIIQGLMAILVLFYSKDNKKIVLLIPLFLVCILFNARIGFTAVILGVFFYYLYSFKIINLIVTFCMLSISYFILTQTNLFSGQKETVEWGLDFFTQSLDFLTGTRSSNSNTFDTLFGEMMVLPSNESEWLFGNGVNIFGKSFGVTSDVGYIIQLYYGGIIYMSLMFSLVVCFFSYIKALPRKEFMLGSCFLLILLFCNIKGNIFIPIGILRLIVLMIIYWFINSKNRNFIKTKINE